MFAPPPADHFEALALCNIRNSRLTVHLDISGKRV